MTTYLRHFFLVLLALCASSTQVLAQYENIRFTYFDKEYGLSQNSVLCMMQDRDGFIWVGTEDGLNRFDGYGFTVFNTNRRDFRTISDNTIHSIAEDKDGRLWIATENEGVNVYNKVDGLFVYYRHQANNISSISTNAIKKIFVDSKYRVWIGTNGGGLNLFEASTQSFTRINQGILSKISRINDIVEDYSGLIWMGTNRDGLFFYNPETGYSEQILLPGNIQHILSLSVLNGTTILIGTMQGLYSLNVNNKKIKKEFATHPILSNEEIKTILINSENQIILGTLEHGIFILTDQLKEITQINTSNKEYSGLNDDEIFSIIEDVNNNILVGTSSGGINRFNVQVSNFVNYAFDPENPNGLSNPQVRSIYKTKNNKLLVGTDGGGLNIKDPIQKRWRHKKTILNNPKTISSNSVRYFVEKSDSEVWVATFNGLNSMNIYTEEFQRIAPSPFIPEEVSSGKIRSMAKDKNGNLWLGFENDGIVFYNPTEKKGKEILSPVGRENTLEHSTVYRVVIDDKGIIWAGTGLYGLVKIHPETHEVTYFEFDPKNELSISKNIILSIYEDSKKRLWIGTAGAGINLKNRIEETFQSFTVADGLPNNVIYDIIEDESGLLWVTTNQGISKFDPDNKTFVNYNINDGLLDNEFNTGASFKDLDGEIYFGGISGFISFYPNKIKTNQLIPKVFITDFKIFDTSILNNGKASIQFLTNASGELLLPYNKNFITFEFTAINYLSTSKNSYAYRLNGFDDNWIFSGNRRYVSYTNLDPGKYVFEVKASNNDGVWNETPISVPLVIIPPIYKTTAAYFIYLFLFVLIIYLFIRWRASQLETEKILLEIKVKEKTEELENSLLQLRHSQEELVKSEKMRVVGQLASGIAHDINNILSIILGSVELLKANRSQEVLEKKLRTIEASAIDGATIIKSLQEFSKNQPVIESQLVQLDLILSEVADMTAYKLIQKKKMNGIEIHMFSDLQPVPELKGNASELRTAFTNLVINAIDAFTKPGKILLSCGVKDNKIQVLIQDEGSGMPAEIKERIFEPFFTTKGVKGSGLGLSQVFGIIQRHSGSISVDTELGKGTVFVIEFPIEFNQKHSTNSEQKATTILILDNKNRFNKKVLIVEDEKSIQGIYEAIFKDMNIEPTITSTGEEGLGKWASGTFDFIISDIGLPGISGWDFISEIRKKDSSIPIIVITGWGHEISEERILQNKIKSVIAKPFKLSDLNHEINDLFSSVT